MGTDVTSSSTTGSARAGWSDDRSTEAATRPATSDSTTHPAGRVDGLRSWWRRPDLVALLMVAASMAVAVLWAMQDALVDDAYISLDYARTLAEHGQWGPLPGVPSNTATSPLNVVILAAITLVVRSPMAALWIVTIGNALALAVGLLALGQRWLVGRRFAWVALPFLLLNPLLASTIGLETMLSVTLMVWLLERAAVGDWRRFGYLAGLGVVLRPDLVIVVVTLWVLHQSLRRPSWLAATWGTTWRAVVAGGPWYVFSWFYFGSAIPDTLVIKQGQTWGRFTTGLWERFHVLYPAAIVAVLTLAALGALALLVTPLLLRGPYRPAALRVGSAGIAGAAHFSAYSLLGVPPYFWYYAVPTAALSLTAAFGISALSLVPVARRHPHRSRALCAFLAVAAFTPALVSWSGDLSDAAPLNQAPIHGNFALPNQYKQIGNDLAGRFPPGTVIRSAGEFGTILYYCDCTLLDRFDQRGLIMDTLVDHRESSWLMRLNYHFLRPDGYPLLHQDYYLAYRAKASTNEDDWNVISPTRKRGHIVLRHGSSPSDVRDGLAP